MNNVRVSERSLLLQLKYTEAGADVNVFWKTSISPSSRLCVPLRYLTHTLLPQTQMETWRFLKALERYTGKVCLAEIELLTLLPQLEVTHTRLGASRLMISKRALWMSSPTKSREFQLPWQRELLWMARPLLPDSISATPLKDNRVIVSLKCFFSNTANVTPCAKVHKHRRGRLLIPTLRQICTGKCTSHSHLVWSTLYCQAESTTAMPGISSTILDT